MISERLLEDQGITNLNDALRNVAGVSTFGGGEGGGGVVSASDKVTIRGFDARSNIYVDGIRDIAGYSRDTFNYEAVEVIKGGSGSLDALPVVVALTWQLNVRDLKILVQCQVAMTLSKTHV